MTISRTTAYALHALVQLATFPAKTPIPCRQLAETGKMPERFLLQILRNLVTKGILQSTRGVDGGYFLLRTPDEITLLEIMEAVEGSLQPKLPEEHLPKDVVAKLTVEFSRCAEMCRKNLGNVTLAHLSGSAKRG